MSAKRFSLFTILELVGKNDIRIELPTHLKIHDVVNVMYTVPYSEQLSDIAAPVVQKGEPVPTLEGNEYVVEKILKHRKRGYGYQFLTLMREAPIHDAELQPSRDFIDADGTINEEFLNYIKNNNI